MTGPVLAVLLSVVSAVAYAGGAVLQERVALTSPGRGYAPVRRPGWWAAVTLNGLGALLHVAALAYGPLSLVQPLGALTIVFALPMAALFVGHRRTGAGAWQGAAMATVGLAGLLALVGGSGSRSLDDTSRVFLAAVTGGSVVTLMTAARAAHGYRTVRSILLATASGISFGMASVFTKAVAGDWVDGPSVTDLPSMAVCGVMAVGGLLLSQASYQGAGLAAPLATLTVVNPVVAAVVGLTLFGESLRHGTTGVTLAVVSGVVAAGGLILLTREQQRVTAARGAQDPRGMGGIPPGLGPQAVQGIQGVLDAQDIHGVQGAGPDGQGVVVVRNPGPVVPPARSSGEDAGDCRGTGIRS